jgi:hypothetical protein
MSALCHNCSCHLNPPCHGCVSCAHPDGDRCPEGDCQNCKCIIREEPVAAPPRREIYRELRDRWDEEEALSYRCKPYYKREEGYAEVRYYLRPMTPENKARVIAELIAKHTYFGHGWHKGALAIYVD